MSGREGDREGGERASSRRPRPSLPPPSQHSDVILAGAATADVAFCVVGDPFGATTHTDLQLRAAAAGVPVAVVHNASIMNAVGCAGLQLYRYGEAVSLVFFTDTWAPDSFYDRVAANRSRGLHTLVLLDIKVKEPTEESLARGKPVFGPPRYMTADVAAAQLLRVEAARTAAGTGGAYSAATLAVALARVGGADQAVVAASLGDLASGAVPAAALGPPLHTLVLAGDVHPVEAELLAKHGWGGGGG